MTNLNSPICRPTHTVWPKGTLAPLHAREQAPTYVAQQSTTKLCARVTLKRESVIFNFMGLIWWLHGTNIFMWLAKLKTTY